MNRRTWISIVACLPAAVALAGGKNSKTPCYQITYELRNESEQTLDPYQHVTAWCAKGGEQSIEPPLPGCVTSVTMCMDPPIDGLPAHWMEFGGDVVVFWYSEGTLEQVRKHCACLAYLSKVVVIWRGAKRGGVKCHIELVS
jgi:hypothetical protein